MATSSGKVPNFGDEELKEGEQFQKVEYKKRCQTGQGGSNQGPTTKSTGRPVSQRAPESGDQRRTRSPGRPSRIGGAADKKRWYREGRCCLCGSASHKRWGCNLYDPAKERYGPYDKDGNRRSREAPRGAAMSARRPLPPPPRPTPPQPRPAKRGRPDGPSGVTPDGKRTVRPPCPAPWGQQTLHVRHADGKPLKRDECCELEYKWNTWAVVAVTRGESFPLIDSWRWFVHSVEVKSPSRTEAENLAVFLQGKGYMVESQAQFEASKVILHHYVGCVSETMKKMNDEGVRILIEGERIRRKYEGRFEFFRKVADLQLGALIEIVVEEKLVDIFEKDGAVLRLGTSGLTKFEDRTEKKKARRTRTELEENTRQLEMLTARNEELQRQIAMEEAVQGAQQAQQSLATMGIQEKDGGNVADPAAANAPAASTPKGGDEERTASGAQLNVASHLAQMAAIGTNATIRNIGGGAAMETDQEAQGARAKEV
jgi:hypothetical protein